MSLALALGMGAGSHGELLALQGSSHCSGRGKGPSIHAPGVLEVLMGLCQHGYSNAAVALR